ncbi:ParB/RepB/Spo0J family partition protein [Rhodospirillaceae bacterium SYSU D60014]|uniref:ParB/RepB/Spo0J family partition protein n=1 Tax=Virgifigura deserti TaxID=2268457 RepID=UPI000E667237
MSEEGTARRNLGRGLSALLGAESEDYASLDRVRLSKMVPVQTVHPGPVQPRHHFDDEHLKALADSIRQNGILQPLLVRRHPTMPNAFEIVAGERRWRAAQLAQLHEVPVVIRELTDSDALELALVENVQRQDLTPLEEAEGYRRLMDEFQHTQEDLARRVGKSRSHIANSLRLLNLPGPVKKLVESGELTAGHARALLGAVDPVALAGEVVAKGLNVRQTEQFVNSQKQPDGSGRSGLTPSEPASSEPAPSGVTSSGPAGAMPAAAATIPSGNDPDTVALERDLSALLGLRVAIRLQGRGGALTIHYNTLEQLDDVLHRLNHSTQRTVGVGA